MSDEIKEFSLPQKGQIAASMQWNPPSFPQVGAETVVKIWFMGTVPYPGTTDTNLARINATFSAVPSGMRNQLVALAFQPFQNQANIKIELANTAGLPHSTSIFPDDIVGSE